MKAKLLLRIDEEGIMAYVQNSILKLDLVVQDKKSYSLIHPIYVDATNKEDYLPKLEDAINEATLFINAIPGIKLQIDDSIYQFLEFDEDDEVRKSINQLIVEI